MGGEFAEGADVAGGHLGIAVEFFAGRGEAFQLLLARADHAVANLGGTLRLAGRAHFFVVHGRDIDVDVDAVHEWARNLGYVTLDHGCGALAVAGAVVVKTARTRDRKSTRLNSSHLVISYA